MKAYMERFGFDAKPSSTTPRTPCRPRRRAQPAGPRGLADLALRRRRAHGDRPGRPAGDAAADGPGRGGGGQRRRLMKPHLTARVVDRDGRTVDTISPSLQSTVMKPSTAAAVTDMMVGVVQSGTGTKAAIPGIQVAGKTGTAETEFGDKINNVWFIGFAPAENPRIAVAVTVAGRRPASAATSPHRSPATSCKSCSRVTESRRPHDHRRPLPRAASRRLGRDGRRRLRRGPAARPQGRDQAPAPALRRGRGVRRALPPRGLVGRRAAAPARRRRLRPRRVGRHVLHRDGVPRGAHAQEARPGGGAAGAGARDRPDDPDPARRALCPQARDHPPRPQAPQRHHRRRGPRARSPTSGSPRRARRT